MKTTPKLGFSVLSSMLLVLCGPLIASCGFSVYSPVAPESSDKALLEKAILAMNEKKYSEARSALATVWKSDKSNKTTQLYANAILGDAGFDLYDIVVDILGSAADGSLENSNDILNALSTALTVEATQSQLDDLNTSLTVLGQAADQDSSSLEFQKCLIVGIYAVPVLSGITSSISNIQSTLDTLPTRVAVDPTDNRTCTASTETIESVGEDLSSLIQNIGDISDRISEISSVIENCSTIASDAPTDEVNSLTTSVNSIISTADRGCDIPSTGAIGSSVLPSCMITYVENTASEAVSGDGVVSGCEVFVNCSQGTGCTTSN